MNHHAFEQPILVKEGERLLREIATLDDAIAFLDAWPPRRRDFIYETAWRTCCEVFDGHKPLIAAHNAFMGFARRAKIIEDFAALPGLTRSKLGGGGMNI